MRTALKKSKDSARGRKPRSDQQTALSPADWIDAATDFLINNNINSLDIPYLCRRLGVTKGSFYWHFEGRVELLKAILDDWRQRMTSDVNSRAERSANTVESALQYLLGLIRRPRPTRRGAIERSVREWARTDPLTRASVVEVDQMRLAFFEALFRRHGLPDREAQLRAYAAYALMMGDSILKETIELPCPPDDYVGLIVRLLLGQTEERPLERGVRATR
jgi:AcrR family transcriptional regulator